MLLRPLMWFDRVDPRDPLEITEGVYALLGRYYFKNNANVWLWGLYGNHDTKGWESFSTAKREPEFGGRFQFSLPGGEAAMSFHSRRVDFSSFYPEGIIRYNELFRQNKYGLDGKWDLEVGLWVEYVFKQNDYQRPSTPSYLKAIAQSGPYQQAYVSEDYRPYHYEHSLNMGLDYTFQAGNGLNTSMEHFYIAQGSEPLENNQDAGISALSVNYPVGLLDRISVILYYSWKDESLYRFINFERSYDTWSFYLMAFWNPETFGIYNFNEEQTLFTGTGIQIMVVHNF